MLFKRKAKDEAALQERPPPDSRDNPSAVLRTPAGLHQLWYLELRLREEMTRAARRPDAMFSIAAWRERLLPGEELPADHLRQAAELITKSLRSYDVIAQIDEYRFVAILFDASYENATTVAFRIKGDLQVRLPTGGKWQAGVAAYGRDGTDGDSLIQTTLRRLDEDARA